MSFLFDSVPHEQRCYEAHKGRFRFGSGGDCFFGVPADKDYGRRPFERIPRGTTGFHFYLGEDQQELFDSYTGSELCGSTTSLHIGNSCFELGRGRDYSRLVASLASSEFPHLETLELGVWQLFSNSHCVYGNVGRIDGLADRMPNLKKLYLYGKCELHAPLSIPGLEILHVVVDDTVTGANGGPLDLSTVSNLLSSSFPELRELYLGLETDDNVCYTVPEAILSNDLFPNLTTIELVGTFQAGDKQRLYNSPSLRERNVRAFLDDMVTHGPQAR